MATALNFDNDNPTTHYLFDVITGILFALLAHYKFIRPVVTKCIQGEYDDAFQELYANSVETTSG